MFEVNKYRTDKLSTPWNNTEVGFVLDPLGIFLPYTVHVYTSLLASHLDRLSALKRARDHYRLRVPGLTRDLKYLRGCVLVVWQEIPMQRQVERHSANFIFRSYVIPTST